MLEVAMVDEIPTTPATLGAVLDDDGGSAVSRTAAPLLVGMLTGLGLVVDPREQVLLARELAGALARVLELRLGAVLVRGWRKHRDVTQAARRTAGDPASSEVVRLASHVVTLDDEPCIEVLVADRPALELRIGLTVAITVEVASGTVRGGRLVAISGGGATVKASVSVEGTTIAERARELTTSQTLDLGSGIRLLPEAA
jgi:hypothetical protein